MGKKKKKKLKYCLLFLHNIIEKYLLKYVFRVSLKDSLFLKMIFYYLENIIKFRK